MSHARALPVLMYHHVSPLPGLVTVAPGIFRAQIGRLAGAGYRSVGADDLAAFLAGRPLPPKSVMISFDDGYLDNYVHAHPVLAEFGFKAVLFVVTGWLGDGPPRAGTSTETPAHDECKRRIAAGRADEVMLRWSEAEQMRAAGSFEFHSHTHGHVRWDRQVADPVARANLLAEDLRLSRAALATRLGGASAHLCWPQGYHDASYRQVAQDAGFDYLYTVEKGSVTPATDRLRIPRITAKDRGGAWLPSRLFLYRRPALAAAYLKLSMRSNHSP